MQCLSAIVQKWNNCWNKSGQIKGCDGPGHLARLGLGIRGMGHDPKALVWMVDEGDEFARGVADRPGAAEEIERIIGV